MTAARGETRASAREWEAIYWRLWPQLTRALAVAVGTYQGVDDAVQEAFTKALEHEPADFACPDGWLYTVALNTMRRRFRRERLLRLLVPQQAIATNPLDEHLVRLDIVHVLGRLRPRDRDLLLARYYLGLSADEVARAFKMRRGSASAALSRASKRFRELDAR